MAWWASGYYGEDDAYGWDDGSWANLEGGEEDEVNWLVSSSEPCVPCANGPECRFFAAGFCKFSHTQAAALEEEPKPARMIPTKPSACAVQTQPKQADAAPAAATAVGPKPAWNVLVNTTPTPGKANLRLASEQAHPSVSLAVQRAAGGAKLAKFAGRDASRSPRRRPAAEARGEALSPPPGVF